MTSMYELIERDSMRAFARKYEKRTIVSTIDKIKIVVMSEHMN